MKRLTLVAFIMLLIAGCSIFAGCSHSPNDYDVSSERWQEFFSGTVKTREVNLGYKGATKVTFVDDTVLEVPTRHFHNPGNVKEGHGGIIYEWESKCGCTKVYQWIADEAQPSPEDWIDYKKAENEKKSL